MASITPPSSSFFKIIQQSSSSILHHAKNKTPFSGVPLRSASTLTSHPQSFSYSNSLNSSSSPQSLLLPTARVGQSQSIQTASNVGKTAAAGNDIIFQRLQEITTRQAEEEKQKLTHTKKVVRQWITSIENKLMPTGIISKRTSHNVGVGFGDGAPRAMIFGNDNQINQQQQQEQQQQQQQQFVLDDGYQALNRNARKPNKANKGKRPCSRYARRKKRSKWGNPTRKG